MGSMLGRIYCKTGVRARHVPAADRRDFAARLAVSSAARFGMLRRLGRGGLSARRVLPGAPNAPAMSRADDSDDQTTPGFKN